MKSFRYTLAVLTCGAMLAGCQDDIDERYIPLPADEPQRMVLIEEYTGQLCRNCPTGHEELASIEAMFNTADNLSRGAGVIAVSIHIPNFGESVADGGFITPEAAQLSQNQNVAPAARINRSTASAVNIDQWLGQVNAEIVKAPLAKFDACSATIENGEIKAACTLSAPVELENPRINAWIIEDNIINYQLLTDGRTYDDNYCHRNVYRASITGLNGRTVSRINATPQTFTLEGHPLHSDWKADNISVVFFVTSANGTILNAASTKLTIN